MKLRHSSPTEATAEGRWSGSSTAAISLGARRSAGATAHRVAHVPDLVQLRPADDGIVPDGRAIAELLDGLRADPSVTTVRTSALYPAAVAEFRAAGFGAADSLALLRADLRLPLDPDSGAARRRGARRLMRRGRGATGPTPVRLRHRDLAAAARVDRAAFGTRWAHDVAELGQVREATPSYRARAIVAAPPPTFTRRREIVAFAMAGASTDTGYLQRLAVDPAGQRRGLATALVIDALRWMRRRRLAECLVNTSVDNVAALALYESLGFRHTGEHLEVLEIDVA